MNSSLKEAAERLGPIRDVPRNESGSKELVVVIALEDTELLTISGTLALAKCGVSLLKAKRTIEAAADTGRSELLLPKVASREELSHEMAEAGFDLRITTPPPSVDIKAIRESLDMTQEQFSIAYGLELRTIQNYESGHRKPDTTALSYLDLIRAAPEKIREMRAEAGIKSPA